MVRSEGRERQPGPAELDRILRTGPFHAALRTALAVRGLALHRVRHRLAQRGVRVGVTSLSYWQQGERRPQRPESLRAVTALEEVLELPAGALTRLLEPSARAAGTERPPARSYRSLVDVSDAVEELLAGLGGRADNGLHTLGHFERVHIGPARQLLRRDSSQLVRAHRDGVDRYLAIHQGERGCSTDGVTVRAGDNCRVGRTRRHHEAPIVVAELLFDVRLGAGDTYVFGYAFEDSDGGPCSEYVRGFSYAGGQYVLQIRFEEDALPVRCRRFARVSAGAPPRDEEELTLSGRHRAVHLAEQTVRPGLLGIGWDWD